MESLPRYFRQWLRKPCTQPEPNPERRATRIRRHGDRPNNGNRGRLRITAKACK